MAGYEDRKRKVGHVTSPIDHVTHAACPPFQLASGDRSEVVAALSSVEHGLMKEEMTLMEQLEVSSVTEWGPHPLPSTTGYHEGF